MEHQHLDRSHRDRLGSGTSRDLSVASVVSYNGDPQQTFRAHCGRLDLAV